MQLEVLYKPMAHVSMTQKLNFASLLNCITGTCYVYTALLEHFLLQCMILCTEPKSNNFTIHAGNIQHLPALLLSLEVEASSRA